MPNKNGAVKRMPRGSGSSKPKGRVKAGPPRDKRLRENKSSRYA